MGPLSDFSVSRGLELADGDLAGARIGLRVEDDLLAFRKSADAGALKRRGVDEHVLAAVIRLDETKTLLTVVKLHCARSH